MMMDPPPPLPTDVRTSLPMALLRAREAIMRRYRPLLDSHGVNEQQWRVLRVLVEVNELDAAEVAARANVLPPSLTRMIRLMEEKGLIERGRDRSDGRRVMLRIAPGGRNVIAAAGPESARISATIEAEFGCDKMAKLIELLNELSPHVAIEPADEAATTAEA